MKALLLGAGASYDCGFPLVNELTSKIKSKVTNLLDKFPYLCNNHQIRQTIKDLFNTNMHYEAIIGYLEVLLNNEQRLDHKKELQHVISFFMQAVHYVLLEGYQIPYSDYCLNILSAFTGIKHLVTDNQPLWIFSLNHDIVIEMLANKLDINLRTGFFDAKAIAFNSYHTQCTLLFEELKRDHINQNKFNFFKHGEPGINLLKLHGSLDIFAYGGDINYRKIKFEQYNPKSGIETLKLIATINLEIANYDGVNITNESTFLDEHNEIQFKHNSILSGAHKFSPKMHQIAPPEFLSQFELNIKYIKELVCIGYGFGDDHINEIIKNWLSLDGNRLIIVNPYGEIPSFLTYLTSRICVIKKRTTDYFMDISEEYGDSTINLRPIIENMNKSRDIARDNFLAEVFAPCIYRMPKE